MRWKPYVVISTPPAKDILPKVLIKEWAVNHRRGRMQSSVISINWHQANTVIGKKVVWGSLLTSTLLLIIPTSSQESKRQSDTQLSINNWFNVIHEVWVICFLVSLFNIIHESWWPVKRLIDHSMLSFFANSNYWLAFKKVKWLLNTLWLLQECCGRGRQLVSLLNSVHFLDKIL